MNHPNETWSQIVIEDVYSAVVEKAEEMQEDDKIHSYPRPLGEYMREVAEGYLSESLDDWRAPDGVSEKDYREAVVYELKGFASFQA